MNSWQVKDMPTADEERFEAEVYCKYCGRRIPDGAVFCEHCGSRVDGERPIGDMVMMSDAYFEPEGEVYCEYCGEKIPKGQKTCARCGTPVDADSAALIQKNQNDKKSMFLRMAFCVVAGIGFLVLFILLLDLVEPTNQETPESNKQAAEQLYRDDELPEGTVYFTQFGKKYHLYNDCQYINKEEVVISVLSSAEDPADDDTFSICHSAIAHGCNDVCRGCAERFKEEK